MIVPIICAKCNGNGYINHVEENGMWSETCDMCKGTGRLGEVDMITITRQEYEELLEYKHRYEDLCK